jgi:hypothetical protein
MSRRRTQRLQYQSVYQVDGGFQHAEQCLLADKVAQVYQSEPD